MNPLESVLAKLDGHKATSNGYTAKCPAHDDTHASLTVSTGADGRVLVHCFANCPFENIVAAMGLETRDLMPERPAPMMPRPTCKPASSTTGYASAELALRMCRGVSGPHATKWDYHDASGSLVGVVARWNNRDSSKTFRPVSLVDGRWCQKAMPSPRPLYRLPLLSGDSCVLVVEGEKVADAGVLLGFDATTSVGGAQGASKTAWQPLQGKDVWILPDHDEPGKRYAADVARLATQAGATVKVLDPQKVFGRDSLPVGYDLADAVAECLDDDARVGLREQIVMVADATDVWQSPHVSPQTNGQQRQQRQAQKRSSLDVVCMADVQPREVEWLWASRIPLGAITLGVGRPGVGKSFFTYDLAARITKGEAWPDGGYAPCGDVLIINAEDDPDTIIAPRLLALEADMRRVFAVKGITEMDADGTKTVVSFDLSNVDLIREYLEQQPSIRLVVIDPIGGYLGAGVDAYRDNEVRAFLNPLATLAQQYRVAFFLVCHTRKGEARYADDAVLGSRAFSGIARSVLHIVADEENRDRRLLLPGKSNWSQSPSGLAYYIVGDPPCVEWEPDPIDDIHVDDLLGNQNEHEGRRGPPPIAQGYAMHWLRNVLGDGPVDVSYLREEADAAGFSWSTVRRAQAELKIVPYKKCFVSGWLWALPDGARDD